MTNHQTNVPSNAMKNQPFFLSLCALAAMLFIASASAQAQSQTPASRAEVALPTFTVTDGAQAIKDQGARSVDDVVANDPSIRVSLSPGFVLDQRSVRGFLSGSASDLIEGLVSSCGARWMRG